MGLFKSGDSCSFFFKEKSFGSPKFSIYFLQFVLKKLKVVPLAGDFGPITLFSGYATFNGVLEELEGKIDEVTPDAKSKGSGMPRTLLFCRRGMSTSQEVATHTLGS